MKQKLLTVVFLTLFAYAVPAAGPQVWTIDSRADILKGNADGVSIGDDGRLTLAPKLSEIFATSENILFAAVRDNSGNTFLGTGPDGKVFRVDASGSGKLFADFTELNVSALAVAANGDVFAATMPDGKVYRIDKTGTASVYFEPATKYIWALAVLPDGSLAVATGDQGKIYKVRAAGASPEASVLYDSEDLHIVSLTSDKNGNLYAGTDPSGLLLKISSDGKAFALLDSPLRELHASAVASDGSVYALAIAEAASTVKTATGTPANEAEKGDKPVTVAKPSATAETPRSEFDLAKAKCALYRIFPDGRFDLLWAPESIVGFSLAADSDGVLVGTSEKGRVYKISNERRETLLLQTPAGQVSQLIPVAGERFLAAGSNQATLYGFDAASQGTGVYSSPVLDAGTTASWGTFRTRTSGSVVIETRSGNTESPNNTWSVWSAAGTSATGSAVANPKARYFQWRATLKGKDASLSYASLIFLPQNIAPEITSLTVLPANVGLQPNPSAPADPNIELSGLDPAIFGLPTTAAPPRRLYQRGAVSLQWTASDENDDTLVYDVAFRAVGQTAWTELRTGLTDNFLTIDGQSLADGRYNFRVTARDSVSNPANLALSGERLTDAIEIDNTAPTVTESGPRMLASGRIAIAFKATDTSSFISRAEYSVDGGNWQPIYPEDGIADGLTERFIVDVLSGTSSSLTIRVYDANGNSAAYRVTLK